MSEIQLSRVDLNLLVTFDVLMDEGSVASAAEKLNKTPSAVSHALARLRDQMGDPLMVKVGPHLYNSVADERIDLALLGADKTLPDCLMERVMPPLARHTFMREGHPALKT